MMDWKNLTLRQKIGQTVVLLGEPEKEIKRYGSLEAFLDRYPVGGFFIGGQIIMEDNAGAENCARMVDEYAKASRIPLLFASDMENGCGSMVKGLTQFPYLMALGAARSKELAYAYGKSTALEARSVGIQWTFSPVADLNTNPVNPLTNIRALSDDPVLAVELLAMVVKGMQDHGLAAGAKHFPGDGIDSRDQHMVTTCNSLSCEDWRRMHGAVFQALIHEGVWSIMTGHICLPAFQKQAIGGRFPPATLSSELTTGLLKQEMGFSGVVVSDALVMGGFLGWYEKVQSYVESMKAGTDMLLWPDLAYFDAMEKAVLSGEISMERLDDAVSRAWEMKRKLGLFEKKQPLFRGMDHAERIYVQKSVQEVAEKSITLVRDRRKMLPLGQERIRKVLLVAVTHHDPAFTELAFLKQELEDRGMEVVMERNIFIDKLEQEQAAYDLILYAIYTRPHHPMGPLTFYREVAGTVWASYSCAREKSVTVSFGSPYHATDYFEAADVFISTYSIAPASQRALVKAIFGDIPFEGTCPVILPNR